MPNQTGTTSTPAPSPNSLSAEGMLAYTQSNPSIIVLAFLLGFLYWASRSGGKGKIGTSYWAGSKEREACKKVALAQIKNPRRNRFCLYINTHPKTLKNLVFANALPNKYLKYTPKDGSKPSTSPPIQYVPNAQMSTMVLGKAGSGKTFSVIDPMAMSAMEQGMPILLYDFKAPDQAKLALYARRLGYKVYFFAPGQPWSSCFNPLKLLSSSKDATMADEIIKVITRNCQDPNSHGSGNEFFVNAGSAVGQGTFLLSKWIAEFTGNDSLCDLLTASIISSLPNLAARLVAINSAHSIESRLKSAQGARRHLYKQEPSADRLTVHPWVLTPFSQLISAHGGAEAGEANVTEAGIMANCQQTFQKFIRAELVPDFCSNGKAQSEIPVVVQGKTIVVYCMDQDKRFAIAPLLATGIHLMVTKLLNPSLKVDTGFFLGLDELASLFLPSVVQWPTTGRSAGLSIVAGVQNIAQIAQMYGENGFKTMLGSCGNQFFFNPGEISSAEVFSSRLGSIDVQYSQKSTSSGGGTSSTSTTKVLQQKRLLSPEEFVKLPSGEAVAVIDALGNSKEACVPMRVKFQLSQRLLGEKAYCEDRWDTWIQSIQQENKRLTPKDVDDMIADRTLLVAALFPEPIPIEEDED